MRVMGSVMVKPHRNYKTVTVKHKNLMKIQRNPTLKHIHWVETKESGSGSGINRYRPGFTQHYRVQFVSL